MEDDIGIDATDISTILHTNPYCTRTSLLLQKCKVEMRQDGRFQRIPHVSQEPTSLSHGKTNEILAIQMYERTVGDTVQQVDTQSHRLYHWLRGRPDGISVSRRSLVEIKCPLSFHPPSIEWIPVTYMHQMQAYMEIFDIPTCDYVQYDKWNESIDIIPVPRDPEWLQRVIPSLILFRDQVKFYRDKDHQRAIS